MTLFDVAALVIGYLSGSIPFGLLIAKLGGAGDVRTIGSGNIGATNVLRTGRKSLAAATLLGDIAKGFAPPAVFMAVAGPDAVLAPWLAGLGAFLGHLYPVWLRFKGGKGVATYIGVLLAFSLWGTLVFAVVWLTTAYVARYSSLAALLASFVTPIALWAAVGTSAATAGLFALMTVLVFWKHRANISRLADHREPKIGGAKTGDDPS